MHYLLFHCCDKAWRRQLPEGGIYFGLIASESMMMEHRQQVQVGWSCSWELTQQTTGRKQRELVQISKSLLKFKVHPYWNLSSKATYLLILLDSHQLGTECSNVQIYGDISFKLSQINFYKISYNLQTSNQFLKIIHHTIYYIIFR